MKNKKFQYILTSLRTLLLAAFVFAEFFGFSISTQAACSVNYTVGFDANPKSVPANGSVTFTTTVRVTNSGTDSSGKTITCSDASTDAKKVYIQYFIEDTQSGVGSKSITGMMAVSLDSSLTGTNSQTFSLLNNVYTADGRTAGTGVPVNFNSPPTKYFYVKVFQYTPNPDAMFGPTNKTTSGGVAVSVTAPSAAPTDNGNTGGTPTDNGSQGGTPTDNGNTGNNSNNNSSIDCKANPDRCVYNPLPTDDLTTIFLWIARGFLGIVGIWSVIFIIVGGFRMVMSQGNEEAYGAAKKTITWAVLGLVVALLSFSIVAIVINLLGADVVPTDLGGTK